ncbi:hypothetical protein GCM10007425_18590 [Lysinibacillus alkalisoli]|uniref:CD-NTase-associated protein 15 domain-containing protein n=1 Tax=Lysinibacillus alkalisoli TaxID=1911548 RepID=A0A917LHJ2_9BACI|nr:hypothetical protein [Lysinibacillus alkalisoli]GGG24359.1 hypothetical protein GCM10007425_18590 [Lysinibacillus alkalisoli]
MHEYSIDAKRNKILFYLSLLAIATASLFSALLKQLPFSPITIPITSFTIFLLFTRIFALVLWKKQGLHKIGLVKTPHLSGQWQGTRIEEKTGETYPVTLHIKQNWNKIRFEYHERTYIAVSYATAMQTNFPLGTRVSIAFQIFESQNAALPVKRNDGFIDLIVKDNKKEMQGQFYTNPHTSSHYGLITLTKIED